MSVPYRSPWADLWNQPWQDTRPPLFPEQGAASAITSGLQGAQRNDPSMGGTAADTWGQWQYSPTQNMEINQVAGGGGSGAGGASGLQGGYNAPGWDLSQNRYQYQIPAEFRSNQNMYELGYNQQQDTNRLAFAGGNGQQTNFDRVYSQMNDLAKANGYGDISAAPPALQQWAANAAIGRLRTDYAKTGADWNSSGFAGYDKYLQGAQGQQGSTPYGNPQQQQPTLRGEFTPTTTYQGQQQATPTLGNQGQPATGAEARTQSGLANGAASAIGGVGQQGGNVSVPNFDPMGASGGQKKAASPAAGYNGLGVAGQDLALRDPGAAYQAYRLQNGMTNRSKSKYADFKASLVGQALSSLLNLETTQNPGVTKDNINSIIGKFSGAVQNNGMYGMLGGAAQNAAGRIDFGGLDDVDAEKMMKLIVGAQGLGQSPIGASGLQSQLDDLLYQQTNQDLSTDFESDPLGGKFKGSKLAAALAQLGYR